MLDGRAVLVIESEFLIALDMQRILEQAGCRQVAVIRSRGELSGIPAGSHDLIVLALADGADTEGIALANTLLSAGIAIVVTSPEPALAAAWPSGLVVVVKPFVDEDLVSACAAALAGAREG